MPRTPEQTRVQVRPAVVEDGGKLTEIDNVTWSTDVTPTPRWDPGKVFFPDTADVRNVLVAHDGEDVVGYIRMRPSPFGPMSAHVQHVDGLAVHPAHQGRRAGRALVEAAEREARRRGARRITLRVLGGNAPARALYRSCGYVIEGVLEGEFLIAGRYVDDVLMALDLTDRTLPSPRT